ncbi:hypothetical protein KR044_005082, partial [Drosophila immigrans]
MKAPWLARNDTIRATYLMKTVEETFHLASGRFAHSLANHSNPEAKNILLHPYEPQRLIRARYADQLARHIYPLQQQQPSD